MHYIEPYWNHPRAVAFRETDAYPYVRGLAVIAATAFIASLTFCTLYAAAPLLLSTGKAAFVIAEWSLAASAVVAVGYYVKGYLEQFLELVKSKIDGILRSR